MECWWHELFMGVLNLPSWCRAAEIFGECIVLERVVTR
jgi:hypothetical protein